MSNNVTLFLQRHYFITQTTLIYSCKVFLYSCKKVALFLQKVTLFLEIVYFILYTIFLSPSKNVAFLSTSHIISLTKVSLYFLQQ